jgi:hypothetical protein
VVVEHADRDVVCVVAIEPLTLRGDDALDDALQPPIECRVDAVRRT